MAKRFSYLKYKSQIDNYKTYMFSQSSLCSICNTEIEAVEFSALIREGLAHVECAHKKSRPLSPFPKRRAKRLREIQQNPFCVYCNKKLHEDNATKDHVIPACEGGKYTVFACVTCNQLKSNSSLLVFLVQLSHIRNQKCLQHHA